MWLLIPILIYSIVYLTIRHVYSHWERKGFPAERKGLRWHFLKQVYRREFHYVDAVNDAYSEAHHKLLGVYFLFRPTLLICDVTLARNILQNSCGHFTDTRWDYVKGYRKVNLLEKLAPIFTVSRTEGMFRNVEKVADHMMAHLRAVKVERETLGVDMQQTLRVYAMNIVGNMIYGLDGNSFEKRESIFSSYISNSLGHYAINSYTLNHLPKKSSMTYRLRDIIRESVERRENGGHIRKDILQLLVKFRNDNDIGNGAKQNWHIENIFEREKVLSIKKLSKITETFLAMGLETTASTAVFTLYEILQNPYIMARLLDEIRNLRNNFEKDQNSGSSQLNYADVDGLPYLSACIKETLRKYPAVPVIERICRKAYSIPQSRFIISEGKTIMIPVMALQRDEKYYKEPLKYKPERFLVSDANEKAANAKETFMSYGLGARTCVAQNFSNMVIKLIIVKLLLNFRIDLLSDPETLEIVYNSAPIIKTKEGLRVKLKSYENKANFHL